MPLLESFLQYLAHERHYSAHTVEAYRTDLLQFEAFMQRTFGLQLLTQASDSALLRHTHLRSWVASLSLKRASLGRKLSAVRAFLRFQQRCGHLAANPVHKLKLPKSEKRLPGVAPRQSLTEALDHMPAEAAETGLSAFAATRNLAILELLYGCGLRRAELIGLRLQDVDFAARQLRISGKGNKQRIVPFGQQVEAVLRSYLGAAQAHGCHQTQAFFETEKGNPLYPKLVYNIVHKFLAQFPELAKASPHVLRHTFATHLLDAGADLTAVKELLGHASLASTQVYVHTSAQRLKRIHQQAHPRGE